VDKEWKGKAGDSFNKDHYAVGTPDGSDLSGTTRLFSGYQVGSATEGSRRGRSTCGLCGALENSLSRPRIGKGKYSAPIRGLTSSRPLEVVKVRFLTGELERDG
jgi:hypothetical protein